LPLQRRYNTLDFFYSFFWWSSSLNSETVKAFVTMRERHQAFQIDHMLFEQLQNGTEIIWKQKRIKCCINFFEQKIIKNYFNKFRQIEQMRKRTSTNRSEKFNKIGADAQISNNLKTLWDKLCKRGGKSKNLEIIKEEEQKTGLQEKKELW
jgi:hypothetical protein